MPRYLPSGERGLHHAQKDLSLDRLREEGHRPCRERSGADVVVAPSAQDDDRHAVPILDQPPLRFEAVNAGQPQIENHASDRPQLPR
jgi:hypothetical protein